MKLSINANSDLTLGGLKNAFHSEFPQLKIEFYRHAHAKGTLSPPDEMLHQDDQAVALFLREESPEIVLAIEPQHTVWETEQQFESKLHLHVQLFRQMGNTWIATSKTDQWSLARQTERSLETLHIKLPDNEDKEGRDYHEQE